MTTAPLVVQKPFDILEQQLGPAAERYRAAFQAYQDYNDRIDELLVPYDERMNALEGTEEEIEAAAALIVKERDQARQRLLAANAPPPFPDDVAGIDYESKRMYHLLIEQILSRAEKDMANMKVIIEKMVTYETEKAQEYVEKIESEIKKKEARDARAERHRRRREHRSRNWGAFGQTVGGTLSAIPTGVTQVIGAVISIGTAAAQVAYNMDSARKFAHELRNNANWLIYEQPALLTDLESAEWNLDYMSALDSIVAPIQDATGMRLQITKMKLDKGIYDERELQKIRATTLGLVGNFILYAGIGYGIFRLIFR